MRLGEANLDADVDGVENADVVAKNNERRNEYGTSPYDENNDYLASRMRLLSC